jgi:hypothetical protein
MFIKILFFTLTFLLLSCSKEGVSNSENMDNLKENSPKSHTDIMTTIFWVGEEANISTNGNISNIASAWDENWLKNYSEPKTSSLKENSFYFALPFNDFDQNGERKENLESFIPWAKYYDLEGENSICKNRWIKITQNSKTAYAQWEDVGPFGEDDEAYVFGTAPVNNQINSTAGLDVSPAVAEYLNLTGLDKTTWELVDFVDVPTGPWLETITTSNIDNSWYKPNYKTSWQWQLSGTLNSNYDVDLYDIDLFDTSKEEIQSLQNEGKKVICYFSAGSFEAWRSDAESFSENIKGNEMDGWNELWLDISSDSLKPIMKERLTLAQEKGCDGVETDNVDGYDNLTGFNLTSSNQLSYNKFLAEEAHKRGLSIGLKNDLNQIDELIRYFDFAVNEQCHEYNECQLLTPFIKANKPVFNAEYNVAATDKDALCQDGRERHFQTLILPLNLDDSFRESCDEE